MNNKEISQFISLILRHRPDVIGIELDAHGWANVNEMIDGISKNYSGFSWNELKNIVETDSKQRYSFNDDHTMIRANQGHSIPVDLDLSPIKPPSVLYHGTGEKYVGSIDAQGLKHKSRQYVHLSSDIDTAISIGKRHGEPIVYEVDCEGMFDSGYEFYISANGVWLTKFVPDRYLKKLSSEE